MKCCDSDLDVKCVGLALVLVVMVAAAMSLALVALVALVVVAAMAAVAVCREQNLSVTPVAQAVTEPSEH